MLASDTGSGPPGSTNLELELAVARAAAQRAGALLMSHYEAGSLRVDTKPDGTPVSRADLEANAVILHTLRVAFPDDAILSEESPDAASRLGKSRVWIVDPLDGTRDFLARTGDFCVHVALAIDGAPRLGVVHHPTSNATCHAVSGRGAFREGAGTVEPLRVSGTDDLRWFRVGISRHNAPPRLMACLEPHGLAARAVPSGASVKYLRLASGNLDAIVTVTGGEKEWDTAAPEVIVREAGGVITDGDGRDLRYNQPDVGRPRGIVVSNGRRHDDLVRLVQPHLAP